MTDVTAMQLVKMEPGDMPRASVLNTNMTHSALHYTPSSEPGFGRIKR
jgi:hypothetical protein